MNNLARLGLGTVQWGLSYGLANQNGMTTPAEVKEILAAAQCNGIQVLDTASAYGTAEAVLGANSLEGFRVVTKTPKFSTPAISDSQVSHLIDVFHQSLRKLSSKQVYGLLMHGAEDLLVPGGNKLLAAMRALKESGAVEKIGVSVYDSEQAVAVLNQFTPDIVQLPISVLDQRLLLDGSLERMKNAGVELHARSVFLQGLLLMPLGNIHKYFDPIRPLLARWHAAVEARGMSPTQAALSFVRDIPFVDTVLIGVESLDQFRSCSADFEVAASFDASGFDCPDPKFVNPAHWKLS